ncbi:MAG: hypothetical protein ACI9AR_000501 [Flavobacteriaceae bacterium]|jgi:hypothetical protein
MKIIHKQINKHPILKHSFNLFRNNLHIYLPLMLIILGLSFTSELFETYTARIVIGVFLFIISIFFTKAILLNQEKEKITWHDIIFSWRELWKYISTMTVFVILFNGIIFVVNFATFLATLLAEGNDVAHSSVILVYIITMLILAYAIIRMIFIQLIIFDKSHSSFKKRFFYSWKITKGYVLKTSILTFSIVVCNLIAFILPVGIIITIPFTGLAFAYFYKKLERNYTISKDTPVVIQTNTEE